MRAKWSLSVWRPTFALGFTLQGVQVLSEQVSHRVGRLELEGAAPS
jgi:hypothetical protein